MNRKDDRGKKSGGRATSTRGPESQRSRPSAVEPNRFSTEDVVRQVVIALTGVPGVAVDTGWEQSRRREGITGQIPALSEGADPN